MNEEAENLEEIQEDIVEEEIQEDNPEGMDKALSEGWKPEDEWTGAPGEWVDYPIFNERGVWINKLKENNKRIDDIEHNFDKRLENVNNLHSMQLETQKKDLERKRGEAVENGDTESFNSIQSDIDNINTQSQQVQQSPNTDQAVIDAWNANNLWAQKPGPKRGYASDQYNSYLAQGISVSAALSMVDADIAREFPEQNIGQNNHATSEGGSPPGKKRAPRKLTMADCTAEELNIYKKMPGTWATDADFLKTVQDSRGEK